MIKISEYLTIQIFKQDEKEILTLMFTQPGSRKVEIYNLDKEEIGKLKSFFNRGTEGGSGMSNAIVKKTHKGSFFRTVKTAREGYNWESLEIKGFDVLQVMVLNQRFVVVEYGQCEEASE